MKIIKYTGEPIDALMALYNGSMSSSFLAAPSPTTLLSIRSDGESSLTEDSYVDYFKGMAIKVDFSKKELNLHLFDRDNGEGAGMNALSDAGLQPIVIEDYEPEQEQALREYPRPDRGLPLMLGFLEESASATPSAIIGDVLYEDYKLRKFVRVGNKDLLNEGKHIKAAHEVDTLMAREYRQEEGFKQDIKHNIAGHMMRSLAETLELVERDSMNLRGTVTIYAEAVTVPLDAWLEIERRLLSTGR